MTVGIGAGVREVWVVWRAEYDGSGTPTFLAAYAGDMAEASAQALVELVKRADASGRVEASPVKIWPLLQAEVA